MPRLRERNRAGPAPARLIEGGPPTDALVAQVLVSKYADHLALYRQAQIFAHQGISSERSTLADWVGRAAFLLRPVHERLLKTLKRSGKLFADETTVGDSTEGAIGSSGYSDTSKLAARRDPLRSLSLQLSRSRRARFLCHRMDPNESPT